MRKRIGVCAALALCVSIAASVPAFAAKDDAIMVEALSNESAEVNGIVPELHVEDAERLIATDRELLNLRLSGT